MSRKPYRGLGYDPRPFIGRQGLSHDAFQARSIARLSTERPIAAALNPQPDAWSIVKSNDAAATFDVTGGTKGPVEKDIDAGSDHWLFIHLNQPSTEGS